jgi:hypothetical protein
MIATRFQPDVSGEIAGSHGARLCAANALLEANHAYPVW